MCCIFVKFHLALYLNKKKREIPLEINDWAKKISSLFLPPLLFIHNSEMSHCLSKVYHYTRSAAASTTCIAILLKWNILYTKFFLIYMYFLFGV